MKSNYSCTGDEIPLRNHNGVFMRQDQPGGIFGTIETRSVETAFLDALDALDKQGRLVNATLNQPNYAPKTMTRMREMDRFRIPALTNAHAGAFPQGRNRGPLPGASSTQPCLHRVRRQGAGAMSPQDKPFRRWKRSALLATLRVEPAPAPQRGGAAYT